LRGPTAREQRKKARHRQRRTRSGGGRERTLLGTLPSLSLSPSLFYLSPHFCTLYTPASKREKKTQREGQRAQRQRRGKRRNPSLFSSLYSQRCTGGTPAVHRWYTSCTKQQSTKQAEGEGGRPSSHSPPLSFTLSSLLTSFSSHFFHTPHSTNSRGDSNGVTAGRRGEGEVEGLGRGMEEGGRGAKIPRRMVAVFCSCALCFNFEFPARKKNLIFFFEPVIQIHHHSSDTK